MLYIRCKCGKSIDVLKALDDNSATYHEDNQRYLASSTWLATFIRCDECCREVCLSVQEVLQSTTAIDPLGNQVSIPLTTERR